jgi:hypothetical protein
VTQRRHANRSPDVPSSGDVFDPFLLVSKSAVAGFDLVIPFAVRERIQVGAVFRRAHVLRVGEWRMPETGEYRAHATECVRLAQQTTDPQSKRSLLDMARAWLALVNQGEKNSEAPTLVYETPEPRRQIAQQQQQSQPRKA